MARPLLFWRKYSEGPVTPDATPLPLSSTVLVGKPAAYDWTMTDKPMWVGDIVAVSIDIGPGPGDVASTLWTSLGKAFRPEGTERS
jgi:hypothetical protein